MRLQCICLCKPRNTLAIFLIYKNEIYKCILSSTKTNEYEIIQTPPCGRSVYSLRQFKTKTHFEKNKVRGFTTEHILVF